MGELLMEEGLDGVPGVPWSVERRFRVTEVFLAVLWVRTYFLLGEDTRAWCWCWMRSAEAGNSKGNIYEYWLIL